MAFPLRGAPRQAAVVAATLANVVVNGLAGAGLLFGVDTGAISDGIRTAVTPAGPAFAIWGVIFTGALVTAAWQARPAARGPRYDALGTPLALANVLCGVWQLVWLNEAFGPSVLVICGLLAALVALYVRLDRMQMTRVERWTLGVPAALFLAWVTVAAPVNLTAWLWTLGWTDGALWGRS